MNPVYEKLLKCYDCVQQKFDFDKFRPDVAIVLGSGLGEFAQDIDIVGEVSYGDIDGFPVSTVPGHAGKFIFGYVGDVKVVCMKGRVHYYEGYDITDVVLPVRLMKMMGAKILFLTNACGGINPTFEACDFMMITDHVSLFAPNPLIGANIEELGTRFPDMSEVYDKDLRVLIKEAAAENNIKLQKGVYAQLTGPSFESPAEIKMLHTMGVDVAGMSTVVEAIAANHMGMKICGISFVSNLAAGISPTPLTHEEVQEAANIAGPKFRLLVAETVKKFTRVL
ncbi:MAG: purine-nucleoside phosphorylase [Firmicutes bacterium]|nr:purine-nucleoside phosphorylase [Bacillota bacterium]